MELVCRCTDARVKERKKEKDEEKEREREWEKKDRKRRALCSNISPTFIVVQFKIL